jgi:hypothetical protein
MTDAVGLKRCPLKKEIIDDPLMGFIGMARVLVLGRRHRLWARTSVAELLGKVEKRGELHFSTS